MFFIPSRFNGPPTTANGGYACGCIARRFAGPAQIRLHKPPPLDAPIEVLMHDGEAMVYANGHLATGRRGRLEWTPPPAPTLARARAARERYVGFERHVFPTCFVCGPDRQDGLRLFAGPLEGTSGAACDWTPSAEHAREAAIDPAIVWAALDCPSFFGMGVSGDAKYLLGEMTADVPEDVPVDRQYVVYGWSRGQVGRKHFAASALADETGRVWARAEHVWLSVED